MIKAFSPQDVKILDSYINGVMEKDVAFLNTFNADKLLFNFRLTAGLPNKKASSSYAGWENTRIGGHTLGHYLAAAAQAIPRGFGATKGKDGMTLEERLNYLVEGLLECQEALGTGFIFGATMADPSRPELQFDLVESENPADTWVPWYTVHKLMNGLVEAWKSAGSETALKVAENFALWIHKRVNRWTSEIQKRVLSIEYGGMNDCLYELYRCARDTGYHKADKILKAARAFDETDLFEAVLESWKNGGVEPDVLNNRHANTTIPKFVGAINRHLVTGDEKSLEYAAAFWDVVVKHHTYITGGNSECEHFGKADILDAERSNTNCETCNTHNMLKLTRMLFMATGERKYADYYENTFLNAIMASVNGKDGMTLYFQPMATGLFKTFCNPDVEKNFFWCCTGTGLENFTKPGDSFYFRSKDLLYVNCYISSSVRWQEKGIVLTQETDIPLSDEASFTISTDGGKPADFTLALRMPDWLASSAQVELNGTTLNVAQTGSESETTLADDGAAILSTEADSRLKDGYLLITRSWHEGDQLKLSLPMNIVPYSLPDNQGTVYGFKFGPVVLAAELGSEKKYLYQIGVMCDVAGNKYIQGNEMKLSGNYGGTSGLSTLPEETLHITEFSTADYISSINSHFQRIPGTLNFILRDTDWKGDLIFSPYNMLNEQRYGIYWLFSDTSAAADLSDGPNEKETSDHRGCRAKNDESQFTEIQGIGVGYGAQTEGNGETFPFMEETGTGSVGNPNELTRYAREGGSFSYMMETAVGKKNVLECTLLREDTGKTICITAGEEEIASMVLDYDGKNEKYTVRLAIPESVTASAEGCKDLNGKGSGRCIRVSFSGIDGAQSARIAAPLRMLEEL